MSTREELSDIFRARYTPDFVKQLAAEGNPTLAAMPRMEDWTGPHLVVGGKKLERAKDYERVQFSATPESMIEACDKAIRALGARIERTLKQGERTAKSFSGETIHGMLDGLGRWEGRPVTLYSLGPVPQALTADELPLYRICLNPTEDAQPLFKLDAYEARFGYYANTGPTE